jgi:predicted aconitase with swiveling domain
MTRLKVQAALPGDIEARLCVLRAPLSLWGGFDVSTGTVIDENHPDKGANLAGRILAMREARGSSSSSSALVEAVRCGTAPAGIVLSRIDPILLIGALVAKELYEATIPVLILPLECWPALRTGALARFSTESSEIVLLEDG